MPSRTRRRIRTPFLAAGAVVIMSGLAACGGGSAASTSVTVLAAASLTEAFTEIEEAFEQANPDTDISISFGPSSGLVAQVLEGAAADVLVTANATTMQTAVDAGAVEPPQIFATNALTVAVPVSNPAAIAGIADLAQPGVLVAMCQPRVPCGSLAEQVISESGLPIEPVTYELDVKAVLAKVVLDEVDAGFVYRSDVIAAAGDVMEVPLPDNVTATASYPAAVIAQSPERTAAQEFVEFLTGPQASAILSAAGFRAAP